ncbi:MAG: hypothetical protein ACJ0GH_01005 [Alphaproteobacteria bacterium]
MIFDLKKVNLLRGIDSKIFTDTFDDDPSISEAQYQAKKDPTIVKEMDTEEKYYLPDYFLTGWEFWAKVRNDKGFSNEFKTLCWDQMIELWRLNNYLYFISEPFYSNFINQRSSEGFLLGFYNVKKFEQPNSLYEEIYEDEMGSEISIWKNYGKLYFPGTFSFFTMTYIEKFLFKILDLLEKKNKNLNAKDFKYPKMSIYDSLIRFLRDDCQIKFDIPSELVNLIFKCRIARNKFAHGDWKDLEKYLLEEFKNIKASDLLLGCNKLTNMICYSASNK